MVEYSSVVYCIHTWSKSIAQQSAQPLKRRSTDQISAPANVEHHCAAIVRICVVLVTRSHHRHLTQTKGSSLSSSVVETESTRPWACNKPLYGTIHTRTLTYTNLICILSKRAKLLNPFIHTKCMYIVSSCSLREQNVYYVSTTHVVLCASRWWFNHTIPLKKHCYCRSHSPNAPSVDPPLAIQLSSRWRTWSAKWPEFVAHSPGLYTGKCSNFHRSFACTNQSGRSSESEENLWSMT